MGKEFSVFSVFSLFFQWMFGQNRSQDLRGPQLIILTKYGRISTTPDPFCNDFTFLIFFFKKKSLLFSSIFLSISYFLMFFWKKKMLLFWSISYFSWFVELQRLRDPSQLVDLAESFPVVASRASETSKISKWCKNNVPKRSKQHRKRWFKNRHQKKMVIVPLEFTWRRKGVA